MPLVTAKDEQGQQYLLPPPNDNIPRRSSVAARRHAAAAMVNDLLANTPMSFEIIAKRLGVAVSTIEKYRVGASAPIAADFEELWRFWNYHMAQAKSQGRTIHHPTEG